MKPCRPCYRIVRPKCRFRPEHVLAMEATPQNRQRAKAFFTRFLTDISALPGVVAVGAISALPETSIPRARIGSITFRRS
jgi:hypothetical protein